MVMDFICVCDQTTMSPPLSVESAASPAGSLKRRWDDDDVTMNDDDQPLNLSVCKTGVKGQGQTSPCPPALHLHRGSSSSSDLSLTPSPSRLTPQSLDDTPSPMYSVMSMPPLHLASAANQHRVAITSPQNSHFVTSLPLGQYVTSLQATTPNSPPAVNISKVSQGQSSRPVIRSL